MTGIEQQIAGYASRAWQIMAELTTRLNCLDKEDRKQREIQAKINENLAERMKKSLEENPQKMPQTSSANTAYSTEPYYQEDGKVPALVIGGKQETEKGEKQSQYKKQGRLCGDGG